MSPCHLHESNDECCLSLSSFQVFMQLEDGFIKELDEACSY